MKCWGPAPPMCGWPDDEWWVQPAPCNPPFGALFNRAALPYHAHFPHNLCPPIQTRNKLPKNYVLHNLPQIAQFEGSSAKGRCKGGESGVVATAALQLTAIIAAKIVLFALLLPLLLAVRSVCSKVSPARVYWHFKRYRKLTENYQKLDYRTMSICVCKNL